LEADAAGLALSLRGAGTAPRQSRRSQTKAAQDCFPWIKSEVAMTLWLDQRMPA
jgi:hypothetical protein